MHVQETKHAIYQLIETVPEHFLDEILHVLQDVQKRPTKPSVSLKNHFESIISDYQELLPQLKDD